MKSQFSRWVAGWAVLAFSLTGLVPPQAAAVPSVLRQEPVLEASGLEELQARLQERRASLSPFRPLLEEVAVPPVLAAAGMEERVSKADARNILKESYPGWADLRLEQQKPLIDYYVGRFDVDYAEFKRMMAEFRGETAGQRTYDLAEPPFPSIKRKSGDEVARGKRLVSEIAFLLGAGGAGGRLFESLGKLARTQNVQEHLGRWGSLVEQERLGTLRSLNQLLDEENLLLVERLNADIILEKIQWLDQAIPVLKTSLIEDLGLGDDGLGPQRLQELLARMGRGELTKPTLSLGFSEGQELPSPMEIWLRTIAKVNPNAVVVVGISFITEPQIVRYLNEAYQGLHGSPAGTYFGLTGSIALVSDDVVPVMDASTKKLAVDAEGWPLAGGAGGAGSLVSLTRPIRILQPDGTIQRTTQTGFQWLRGQGKKSLYIGDADTVGTTPELINNALGLMERHSLQGVRPPAVAFAYPYPAPDAKTGKKQARGRLVNVILDKGTKNERRVLINREANDKELSQVRGLKEAIDRTPNSEVATNAGVYLNTLDALEPLVVGGFPWHVTAPRPEPALGIHVQRFELYKPDVYELLARSTNDPIFIPIVHVEDGHIIPTKDTRSVAVARERYLAIAPEIAAASSLWPKTDTLTLNNTEVVIPYSAFAGRGDAAHLAKTIDALNARGIVPTVILLDEGEGAQAARQKLSVVMSDFPQLNAVFVPQDQLKPLSKQPVILEIFTVIGEDLRARAQEHVKLVAARNQSGRRPVVLAIHAPPSREPWVADSAVADTVNLFMELPAQGQPLGSGSLYGGYLYDRVLQKVTMVLKTSSQPEFRDDLLGDLNQQIPLSQALAQHGLDPDTFRDSFWAFRYSSVLGNPAEQGVLVEAMRRLNRPVVIFTFYDPANDNRPEYALKYGVRYAGHTPLVNQLLAEPGVNFVDLSGHYSAKTKVQPGAKVTVVNFPSLTQPAAFTRLMGASDQADVTGLFSLLESLGLAFNSVGPLPVYLPTQDSFESLLTQPLSQAGAPQEALQLIDTLFRPIRGSATKQDLDAAVEARVRLATDPKTQALYRSALSQVVDSVARQLKKPALMNHFNLLTDTLGAIDQGQPLDQIVQRNHAAGLQERQRGGVLQRLANLPGTRAVVIEHGAVDRYPELEGLVGQTRSVGNTQFIVLPEQLDARTISGLLAPLLSAPDVTLLEYGDPGAFASVEGALRGLGGITLLGPYSLQGNNFLTAFRQILVALSGLEEKAISESELAEVLETLGLGVQL